MYVTRQGNVWYVACAGLRVSPECQTKAQAQAWLDKLCDFNQTRE